jgi:MarR family transcriptional regulator, transcriptional regulator for hemolysin
VRVGTIHEPHPPRQSTYARSASADSKRGVARIASENGWPGDLPLPGVVSARVLHLDDISTNYKSSNWMILMDDGRLRESFGSLVSQTARQWRRAVDLRLQPLGLTEATWLPLLRISRAAEPMRQKDLAASLFLDSSSVVRLLDNLQKAGLIERHEGTTDRRAKTIVLTPRGQSIVDIAEAASAEIRKSVLAELSQSDLAVATRVLQQICQKLAPAAESVA